jgi:hypothetical protein
MKFGSLARVRPAALLALCFAGCITSGDARDEDYAIFRSRSGGYLRVSLDRNQYEANDEPPTKVARGSLSGDEYEQLGALTSDELMAHYVETSASDREACLADPAAFSLSTRRSVGGCWVPSDVTDGDTKSMLDFLVPLLEQYVPDADGSQPSGDEPKDAGAKKDASAAKDAGKRDS